MKVVLVEPGFGWQSFNTFGNSHWSSIINHGLCSISAYAKMKGYKDLELIDFRNLRNLDHFVKLFKEKNPDIIGFTMKSCDVNVVSESISLCKKVAPSTKVIVGGIHPTLETKKLVNNQNIDYIITGEGEISFAKLLDNIMKGNNAQRVIHGESPNLDDLPYDNRELYDYKTCIRLPNYGSLFKPPMVTMITSRGCPFKCSFCSPHSEMMFGKGVRYRSVDNVIEELQILRRKYKFKSLKFYDYALTLNKTWIYEFCEKYRKNGFNQHFICQTRADLICKNEESIRALSDSGLRLIIVGFESGSQRILDFLNKKTTVAQNLEAANICKKYGILVVANFMLGIPTETKEEAKNTLELAKKMNPDFTSISFFTPIPGNYLYDYCIKNNLSLIKSYDEYSDFSPSNPKIKGVDYEYLKNLSQGIMGFKFKSKTIGKIVNYCYIKTKRYLGLRRFLVYCYSLWVKFEANTSTRIKYDD